MSEIRKACEAPSKVLGLAISVAQLNLCISGNFSARGFSKLPQTASRLPALIGRSTDPE
jgi:hypothetical protein